MGNITGSLVSGFTGAVANILGKPLDFLSGKNCSLACDSTWDVVCYVENFCVASLTKTIAMLFLLYLVLVFFYLVYKLGVCGCVCHGVCMMLWSCVSCSFSSCANGCSIVCAKMRNIRRARQNQRRHLHQDIEDCRYSSSSGSESEDATRHRYTARSGGSGRSLSRRSSDRRRVYLERSLRPRNHRVMVGVGLRREVVGREDPRVDHCHEREVCQRGVKVTRTSRFAHKGSGRRANHAKEWEQSYH